MIVWIVCSMVEPRTVYCQLEGYHDDSEGSAEILIGMYIETRRGPGVKQGGVRVASLQKAQQAIHRMQDHHWVAQHRWVGEERTIVLDSLPVLLHDRQHD